MAFKPGANNVTVDTISCSGSHVLSVGSSVSKKYSKYSKYSELL
jgi:galacturan 1,4-alpha-galacturonidase